MEINELIKNYGIAITGNIGTGKSFVCNLLKKMKYPTIDADLLSRKASEKNTDSYKEIINFFGPSILNPDESINRQKLSKQVFEKEEKRLALEKIIHPAIEKLLEEELQSLGLFEKPSFWFYEAALIVEKNKSELFKEVWLTNCTNATQMDRLKSRKNNNSESEIKNIIATQKQFREKRKFCHFEINTDFSKEMIEEILREKLKSL